MNEVLAQLHARKSVRAFLDKPIAPADKAAILEAACAAPTAGNQQLYTILDITDQAVKDTLAETCDHQPFIAKAPMVLIFCADCQKWYDAFAAGGCQPRGPAADQNSDDAAQGAGHRRLDDELLHDGSLVGTQGLADTDLPRPLRHGYEHNVHNAHTCYQKGDSGNAAQHGAHHSDLLV